MAWPGVSIRTPTEFEEGNPVFLAGRTGREGVLDGLGVKRRKGKRRRGAVGQGGGKR